jgi:glycosyltransferase involved in cell wall biosynthesis
MISIVIPTREEARYIGETLAYLKRSCSLPHEIIVSDGGSADDTVALAKPLADQVVVFTGARHTPAIGRNDGARVARGEYLLFLDADVRLKDMDHALNAALAHFERDPRLVGLAGPQRVYAETERFGDKVVFGIDNVLNWLRNNVLKTGWACGKCMLVRRSAFEQIGGFNEMIVFGEDYSLFRALAKVGTTRLFWPLMVYHSGRRLHAYGMWKFWYVWIVNGLAVQFNGKARVDEWTPVR